jgi:hypothetical protein
MFGVEEPYPHLAVGKTSRRRVKAEDWSTDGIMTDFLATLLIMRHIAEHTT